MQTTISDVQGVVVSATGDGVNINTSQTLTVNGVDILAAITALQTAVIPPIALYFDAIPDHSGISNYYQLTANTKYVSTAQNVVTASGTPSSTVQFASGSNPIAWITSGSINDVFVQQGAFQFDSYESVNQPVSTTNVALNVYTRTTGGVETFLFTITEPRISAASPTLCSQENIEPMFPCNYTDRLVVKPYAVFTGTTVATTASLYFQGTVNASHLHVPLLGLNQ